MLASDLDYLLSLPDIGTYPGLAASELMAAGLHLPPAHATLLRRSNGVEAHAGYLRLFGIGAQSNVDQLRWNNWAFWKFAWADRVSEYWCFGETAWGDQYAYLLAEMQPGQAPRVFCLDGSSMAPRVIATSFATFLKHGFTRSAGAVLDPLLAPARARFGPLPPDIHLIYQPSLLVGGAEKVENMTRMTSRGAMICNGDVALGLEQEAEDALTRVKAGAADEDRVRLTLTLR